MTVRTLVTLVAMTAVPAARAGEPWADDAAKFEVRFPVKPKDAETQEKMAGGIRVTKGATVASDDIQYTVCVISQDDKRFAKEDLRAVLNGIVAAHKKMDGFQEAKVLREAPAPGSDDTPIGQFAVLANGRNAGFVWVAVANGRAYVVSVIGRAEKDLRRPEVAVFMKSLKIGRAEK